MSIVRNREKFDTSLLVISFTLICFYSIIRVIGEKQEVLWIFVPISILGILFLYEILYTLKNRINIFTATSLYLTFGFLFFYVVPLNQVIWDYWPGIPINIGMKQWAGVWSVMSLVGFFLITISFRFTDGCSKVGGQYEINTRKMHFPFVMSILICVLCHVYVLMEIGGFAGYISSYQSRLDVSIQNYNPYDGMGLLFAFSESVPNLVSIYVVLLMKEKKWATELKVFIAALIFLLILNILFGGLRGSRSTTVWSLFWFIILYHNIIKPLKLSFLVGIGAILFVFMTSYSLYKFGGVEGLQGLWNKDVKAQVFAERYIEDPDKFLIVRDGGRTDVQSYVLQTYWYDEYPLALGRTLFAGAVSFIPGFIYPNKPVTGIQEKTGIFIGDYFFSETSYTTLLTGGYGEFVINFGIFFGLIFFIFYGLVISWIDNKSAYQPKDSVYNLVSPILMLLSIQMLISDSNVISQFLFKYLSVPLLVLMICPKTDKRKNF